MNVTISVFGRLHAFYLAAQLQRRGVLGHLYTTYPRFAAVSYGIDPSYVTTWPATEVAFRAYQKLPAALRCQDRFLWRFPALHDARVARQLDGGSDIVHCWSQGAEQSLLRARQLGALATLQRGSAHIQTQHDLLREEYELHGARGELPHRTTVEREKREYDAADYIFVPSEFARRTFLAHGVAMQKVVMAPLGVSLRQFYGTGQSDGIFRVIFAGTMSLRKGVHYLLQAFAELRLPRAELWLVGPTLPEIEPFFQKYRGSFRYLGKVPQDRLRDYYGQCSLFALCSIEDGFGMVLTQAMACSLPVLCTWHTGGPDIITDGQEGFIVAPRDVEAIQERLLFLYRNREAGVEMGRHARLRAASSLTWDEYGNRILRAFQEQVRQHRDGREVPA